MMVKLSGQLNWHGNHLGQWGQTFQDWVHKLHLQAHFSLQKASTAITSEDWGFSLGKTTTVWCSSVGVTWLTGQQRGLCTVAHMPLVHHHRSGELVKHTSGWVQRCSLGVYICFLALCFLALFPCSVSDSPLFRQVFPPWYSCLRVSQSWTDTSETI